MSSRAWKKARALPQVPAARGREPRGPAWSPWPAVPRRALRFQARTHLPFQKWCVMCCWALQRPDKGQKMTMWSERPPADRLQADACKQAWQVQKTQLVIGVRARVLMSLISLTPAAVSACPRGLPGTPTTRWSRSHYLPGRAPNLARGGAISQGQSSGQGACSAAPR